MSDWIPPESEFNIPLPCGAIGTFDFASGMGYRCTDCFAMWGSIGMPQHCRDIKEMAEIVEKLKGNKK